MTAEEAAALVAEARGEEDDYDRRWELLTSATRAGATFVRRTAERLLVSSDVVDIALGADLVSAMPFFSAEQAAVAHELRWPVPDTAPFSAEDRDAIAVLIGRALSELSDPDALQPCVIAAGKLQRPELLDAVLRHVGDADPDVREACAWSLNGLEGETPSERAVAALVVLADDPVGEVRDWAIFGLGGSGIEPIDTPETRRVFREHVEDSDEDAREEAIRALGLLGDAEMLARSLEFDFVTTEEVELAARLADPRLHAPLVQLRERGWARTSDPELAAQFDEVLRTAIEATDPALFRRREISAPSRES